MTKSRIKEVHNMKRIVLLFCLFGMFAVMLLLTVPALLKGKLSRPQGIALLCIYAAFCVVQFTI